MNSAFSHVLGQLRQLRGVRPHLHHLDPDVVIRRLGWSADYGRVDGPVAKLLQQLCRNWAPDRIGKRIDAGKLRQPFLVLQRNHRQGPERLGLGQLLRPHRRNHLCMLLRRHIRRRASNAAQSTSEQNRLPGLRLDTALDQLRTSEHHQRQSGGLFKTQAVGDLGNPIGFDYGVFGIGLACYRHHPLPDFE